MINNFIELETNIVNKNFEFILLCEIHLSDDDDDSLIVLENYNVVRVNSASRHTGGVVIYIKKHWTYEIIKSSFVGLKCWWILIKVSYANTILYLAMLYRAPGYLNLDNDFYTLFNSYIKDIVELKQKVIITGDFNLNWLVNNISKIYLENIICDNGLKQIVNECTRITKDSKTLIDYVLVNDFYNISAKIEKSLKISDHESILINILTNDNPVPEVKKIKYVKYNKNEFANKIVRSNIMSTYYLNCNIKAELFSNSLKNIINDFVIEKEIKKNYNNCEWFSNELKVLKRKKIKQYRVATIMNNQIEWDNYKILRNVYKNKIEIAKSKYITNKIDYAHDQKDMWQLIKKYVLKNPINEIKLVNFSNEKIENDNMVIANKFNNYFINSIQEINDSIQFKQYNNLISNTGCKFKLNRISMHDLKLVLKSLNNKKDMNYVKPSMFIDAIDLIGENLLSIINKSIQDGVFPNTWKQSLVVPIQKVKKTVKCSEYRPVNMISVESKILEKVVYNQLEIYLDKNNLVYEYQSGFRKNHNCESLLNLIITNWKMAVDDKKVVVAVFLDLRRAFETVNKEILIKKLEMYGIDEIELQWFKSYLYQRTQRTRVNDAVSDEIDVLLGVPQGSVLGVLLFLIYVNDMEKAIELSKLVLFADDALLYIVGDTVDEGINNMNSDLNRLSEWFLMNRLKLNVDKTKYMVINGSVSNNRIVIDNTELDLIDEIKYLGIIIDNRLNFKANLDYICKKISKKLNFFYKIRNNISIKCAIKLFNTIIKPHFEYCSSILFMCNNEMRNRLQKLQNRGMRIILKLGRLTPRQFMLDTLKWLSVSQKIKMNVMILVFKIKNNMLPKYLTSRLLYVGDVHHHFLRNVFNFRLNFFKSQKTHNMLMYNGLKMFNELPTELKKETNLLKFKIEIVKYIKDTFEIL